jgi:hypothetical protein
MNQKVIFFVTLLSSLIMSVSVSATELTAKTNIDGVVIKKFKCSSGGSYYTGNIVNRTEKTLLGMTAYIKSYDSDGDPIGTCSGSAALEPKSGAAFIAGSCNCKDAIFHKIEVK